MNIDNQSNVALQWSPGIPSGGTVDQATNRHSWQLSYGMLAKSGAVPDYPVTVLFPWLWIAMFVFWAGGIALVRRKYR